MDVIAWIGRLVFFLVVLWLALENTATVPLRLTSSLEWQNVPLLAVILVCFVAGVLAGTLAMVPRILRLRRQVAQPQRAAAASQQQADVELALTRAARQGGAAGDLELETRGGRR